MSVELPVRFIEGEVVSEEAENQAFLEILYNRLSITRPAHEGGLMLYQSVDGWKATDMTREWERWSPRRLVVDIEPVKQLPEGEPEDA